LKASWQDFRGALKLMEGMNDPIQACKNSIIHLNFFVACFLNFQFIYVRGVNN